MGKDSPFCPVTKAMEVLGGKWKCMILWHLSREVMRFSELDQAIPSISKRMLTQQLRDLEQDGVVVRKVYAEVPPRVEYGLTPLGESLKPLLDAMCQWGKDYHAFSNGQDIVVKANRSKDKRPF
jgi:DNA-binding HxlR family transcriptional regulator